MRVIKNSKIQLFLYLIVLSAILVICLGNNVQTEASREAKLSLSGDLYFVNTQSEQMWIKTKSKKVNSSSDVEKYLMQLNEGEFNDWRLPSKKELFDLYSIFDMKNNGEVKIRIEGSYWLRNDAGEIITGAWEIGDGCGPERIFYPSKRARIMAVRP